jgi:maltose alpha-D-glucosyltransferase/alpha-amylase
MRNFARHNLQRLRRGLDRMPEHNRPLADKVLAQESEILKRLRAVNETPLDAWRIRCHGHFHLGQVLYTGKDFVFVDFEGDPSRPLGERRLKRPPLRDVAGMIRSFDYISRAALFKQVELGILSEAHLSALEPWAVFWYRWVSAIYLKAYLEAMRPSHLLPPTKAQTTVLLEAYLLSKALDECAAELSHRPEWVQIPLRGALEMTA